MKRDKDYYITKAFEFCVKEKKGTPIRQPTDLLEDLKPYSIADQEVFLVGYLDAQHKLMDLRVITKGLVNRTLVHPREVYRPAVQLGAVAIIAAHNHPSGNIQPSPEDNSITKQLKAAGEIIGISMLDHIIISQTGYYSYSEEGKL